MAGIADAASAAIPGAAWLDAGSKLVGAAIGSPAGPSSAALRNAFDAPFNASGWNVNFSSGKIDSTSSQTTDKTSTDGLSASAANYLPWVALAFGAVILWKLVRKH